jgi:hypothetical protein
MVMSTAQEAASAMMVELGLTVEAVFVPFSQSRHKAQKDPCLNWKVTLKRGEKAILTTDYSAGMAHCPSYERRITIYVKELIDAECERGKTKFHGALGVRDSMADQRILPDPADVLYSLLLDAEVLNYGSFEDWASECGYDPDSRKAEKTYRACMEIALKMRNGIGDYDVMRLREAFQDY